VEDNIKMYLAEITWEGVDLIWFSAGTNGGGGAVMNTVTNLSVACNLEFLHYLNLASQEGVCSKELLSVL